MKIHLYQIVWIQQTVGDSSIGDATLVNNNAVEEATPEISNNEERETDAKLVSSTEDKDYYFENSRLDRDKMYSQMLESYQKMYEGENVSIEQKTMAANEIAKINSARNAIMISENLIKTKGINDVVIFVNDTQISVVIDAEELATEKIAQIQNIVSREMKAMVENIHISCKQNILLQTLQGQTTLSARSPTNLLNDSLTIAISK